jgi:hypothetical protein
MTSKKKIDPIEEELKLFKKSKCVISKASVKKIANVKSADNMNCQWLENWIDQFIRENCYPPQLKSDDFYSLLSRYFEGNKILKILEKVRYDYRRAFPLTEDIVEDDLSWLPAILKADPKVLMELPKDYLL